MIAQPDVVSDVKFLFEAIGTDSVLPDRMVAIICCAYAEKYLAILLGDAFVGPDKKVKEKLLDPNGMMGAFSLRIDLARALNIIGPITHHDLKVIAKVRNAFAHNLAQTSFDDAVIAKHISSLRLPKDKLEAIKSSEFQRLIDGFLALEQSMTQRQKFAACAGELCIALSQRYDPTHR